MGYFVKKNNEIINTLKNEKISPFYQNCFIRFQELHTGQSFKFRDADT